MAASSQTQTKMRRFFRMLWTQIAYVAPAILIVIVGFIFAYQFVRPAPPDRVVMATGHKDGAYFAYGQAYAERFRKEGFELAVLPLRHGGDRVAQFIALEDYFRFLGTIEQIEPWRVKSH
jgi:hypothetical protein